MQQALTAIKKVPIYLADSRVLSQARSFPAGGVHLPVTAMGCNQCMFLQRTSKALLELTPGQRQLSLRERSLLLLAEGTPRQVLEQMYHGQARLLVEQLLANGYLQTMDGTSSAPSRTSPTPMSLAGVRMHLFDLCERMFANRLHDTAEQLRHMLREARDVDSMLQAREHLLRAVQLYAGVERAEALRRQLADMLPERSLDNA